MKRITLIALITLSKSQSQISNWSLGIDAYLGQLEIRSIRLIAEALRP